jgi:hypothetical protein
MDSRYAVSGFEAEGMLRNFLRAWLDNVLAAFSQGESTTLWGADELEE